MLLRIKIFLPFHLINDNSQKAMIWALKTGA